MKRAKGMPQIQKLSKTIAVLVEIFPIRSVHSGQKFLKNLKETIIQYTLGNLYTTNEIR